MYAGERHPSKQWHYSTSQWKLRPAPLYPRDLGLKRGYFSCFRLSPLPWYVGLSTTFRRTYQGARTISGA